MTALIPFASQGEEVKENTQSVTSLDLISIVIWKQYPN